MNYTNLTDIRINKFQVINYLEDKHEMFESFVF